jgi:hypothetical protein
VLDVYEPAAGEEGIGGVGEGRRTGPGVYCIGAGCGRGEREGRL